MYVRVAVHMYMCIWVPMEARRQRIPLRYRR